LSKGSFGSLAEALGSPAEARQLRVYASESDVRYLLPCLPELTELTDLSLSLDTREWTALPEELAACHKLRKLDVWATHLEGFPAVIFELTGLETLGLWLGPQVTRIPGGWGALVNLGRLKLRGGGWTTLPGAMGDLGAIEKLSATGGRLEGVSDELAALETLETLDLSSNQITVFPQTVCQMTWLRALILSHNRISGLPPGIGGMGQLEFLQLASNRIREIPETISQLQALRTLILEDNPLRVPERDQLRTWLAHVERLEMGSSARREARTEEGRYTDLARASKVEPDTVYELDLSRRRRLSELSSEIGEFVNLGRLILRGTRIRRLPDRITELKRLEVLDVTGCPLEPGERERLAGLLPWTTIIV